MRNEAGTVGSIQDITARKVAEERLVYRDRILHAVTVGTALLVEDGLLDRCMPKALKIVGEAMDVDRLLIIQNDVASGTMPALRHFWEAPDVPVKLGPEAFAAMARDLEVAAAWLAPLAKGKPVVTHVGETEGALRRLMDRLQNKSVLVMPIFAGNVLWGAFGIDACKSERHWSAAEIDTLTTFAGVIGGLIQRNEAELALQKSEERFRAVSDTAKDAIVVIDAEGRIGYWNRAAEEMTGYTADEAVGQQIHTWLTPDRFREAAAQGMTAFAKTGQGGVIGKTRELSALRKDGTEIPVELSVAAMALAGERYAVGIMRDISARKQAEQKIYRMARYDGLTGLANRHVFVEAVQQAMARARRTGEGFAVLYLDLDHFKDVNDTLGHAVGDALLRSVARKLKRSVREADTVARFGGDEFAVLATDIQEPTDLAVLANKLLDAIAEPLSVQDNVIRTGTSIGIAACGSDSRDPDSLLSHADVALYRAKSEGRGTYRFFTETMDREVRHRVRLGQDLRTAIVESTLSLSYQPQVDIESGRIVGLEALVRWQHPELGEVTPTEFVATAESSGLVSMLGNWVLEAVCRQVRRWQDQGVAVPRTAVNMSALQFKASTQLERDIESIVSATGVSPDMIEIELTETALMKTFHDHDDLLQRLRDKGFTLAIDDFGTGYSSLDYLRRLPVDRIKIAQSFIGNITAEAGDAMIVKAAISIAREFGLTVVAEGVETHEQLALLRGWGCREAQGFYYARPLPPDETAEVLRRTIIQPAAGP